ncbi:MAG: 4-(cytidine 5'-diphospho)-2-C-methyl-D-erythritol kinase, partial [Lachnospiraceae bacterium]|nr:4-(cytidine 5'-diphospho)-2-C-methyl-D-erythritol kinase [Lachnospiraceae bacterium]
KAAALMKETYSIEKGFFIDLRKHIPVAAGMAGGSADAAATMVGINNMFRLGIPMNRLMELGVKIGADVPYCIMRGTALAEGIGEKLTRLAPMPECHILIAKPPISVSTKSVYGKLDLSVVTHPDIDGMIESLKTGSLSGISGRLMNVLESVTVTDHPIITEYKGEMIRLGASGALMSGSGPTVFGIFEDKDRSLAAKKSFKEKYPPAHVCLTRPFNLRDRNDKH